MASCDKKIVLILVGPTGVGKTYLSRLLATKLPLEIISADSRQIYKYLDIGTAKPPPEFRERTPHHFINFLEPDQHYSAGKFGEQARKIIQDIFDREKTPLIVGGSGLYVRAVVEGFFQEDVKDEKIRETLQQRLEREGSEALYNKLLAVDEEAARRMQPRDSQRIIRALEVYLASGQRLSELQQKKLPPPVFTPLKFGIIKDRQALYNDINERVEMMFRQGLISETASVLDKGYEKNLNSLNTVGYKEVIQYLEGELSYDHCVELVKKNSRHYAKRQLTWFRADPEIKWIKTQSQPQYEKAAKYITKVYRQHISNG